MPFPPSLELDDFGGGGTYVGVGVGVDDDVGKYGGGGGRAGPGSLQIKEATPLPDE